MGMPERIWERAEVKLNAGEVAEYRYGMPSEAAARKLRKQLFAARARNAREMKKLYPELARVESPWVAFEVEVEGNVVVIRKQVEGVEL